MSEDIKPELIEKAANAVRHERAYIAAAQEVRSHDRQDTGGGR